MSKLLQGRLPFERNNIVEAATFNKTVRLIELSLDAFDPDKTPQFTASEIDELKFQAGNLIWNTTTGNLQVWTGTEWVNVTTPSSSGLSATATLGEVQVIASGSIVVVI